MSYYTDRDSVYNAARSAGRVLVPGASKVVQSAVGKTVIENAGRGLDKTLSYLTTRGGQDSLLRTVKDIAGFSRPSSSAVTVYTQGYKSRPSSSQPYGGYNTRPSMKPAIFTKRKKSMKYGSRKKALYQRPSASGTSLLRHRLKCVDLASSGNSPVQQDCSNSNPITVLNATLEGSGFYNRIGRFIRMKSLQLIGSVQPLVANAVVSPCPEYIRIIIFYDKQTNGANPTAANLLLTQNLSGTLSTTDPYSFLAYDGMDRFIIIMDERIALGETAQISGNLQTTVSGYDVTNRFNVNRFFKFGKTGLETHYKGNAGTVADISNGGLFIMTMGTRSTGACPHRFAYNTRIRFADA